jgi:transmembrane sensor
VAKGDNSGPPPDGIYQHPDPATDEALDWFLRLQEMGDDPALQAEFQHWLAGDPAGRAAYTRLQRMQAAPALRKAIARDRASLDRTSSVVQLRPRRAVRRWSIGLAFAAAVLVSIGLFPEPSLLIRWRSDYLTAAGEMRRVRLPDGSDMTLNTASAVALDFSEGRRKVTLLAGEAFFDVRHLGGQPFIVSAHYSDVEVKGTTFDVRLGDGQDTVMLERGIVDVRRQMDQQDRVVLKPGEMVTAGQSRISAVSPLDANVSFAWLDGRIILREQPFDKALDELRRYHSGKVILATSRFADSTVSGNYRAGNSEDAIRTLAETVGASMTRLPGGIIILR